MKRNVEVRSCSITEAGVDVVVNASNEGARLGGGVSRALFEECGGAVLQDEMARELEAKYGDVMDEGDFIVTSAGTSKKFQYIVHVPAVDYRGPRARLVASGVEKTVTSPERIRACTEAALRASADVALMIQTPVSVALPLMGAGAGGLPVGVVCHAMVAGLRDFFAESSETAVSEVVFTVPERDRFETCIRIVSSAFG